MYTTALLALSLLPSALAEGIWATPHDKYSSSVGVLGCKVNTNRIAYWPASVSCDSICVKVSYEGRSVNLLRIDQSGGAHDMSYDAWNYLVTGESARTKPQTGGAVAMEYEDVDISECADLIYTKDGKLPLSAGNSMNYVSSCMASNSWVGKNHALYNIIDSICSWGYDEVCTLDLATSNQPSCPHTLGLTVALTSAPVYDIQYATGDLVLASTGEVVDQPVDYPSSAPSLTYKPSATSKIISSVLQTTFSTRISTQISVTVDVPAPTKEGKPAESTTVTPPSTVSPTPAYPPSETTTVVGGGRFVETAKSPQATGAPTMGDAALALWSSIFIIPVIEKWGSD